MKRSLRYRGRAAVQQRVLPQYRAEFFDGLSRRCRGGLDVFAGTPRQGEAIHAAARLARARWRRADNRDLFTGPAYLCYQSGLVTWLREADPDALVVEANPRYLSTPAGIRWMRARGRAVIGWGLGAPPAGPVGAWFRRRWLRDLSAVIAYSTRGAAEFVGAGVSPDQVFVAPNAVEAPPLERPQARGRGRRPLRVIFVGRLQKRKRIDHLVRACAAASPRPELWIVGDGPDRARLAGIAARTFPEAVFTGAVFGRDVRALLDQADLFVLPGTGGLALQQALARGLPVIAAEGDGSQEDMVTPLNGWLVPPADADALAAALNVAVRDRRRLAEMGRVSYRMARERFNPSAMLEVFVHVLRSAGGDS